MPVGTGSIKVRASRRKGRAAVEQTLGETLGDEEEALVVIDPREMPRAWAQVCAAENIGECVARPAEHPAEHNIGDAHQTAAPASQTAASAKEVQETSYVTLGDVHLDAKLTPTFTHTGRGRSKPTKAPGACSGSRRAGLRLSTPAFAIAMCGNSSTWTG